MAATNTAMIATRACWVEPCTSERASFGANRAPMAAPPRKPAKLSTPMMNPCRYAGHGKGGGERDQDQVKHVTRHEPTV